MGRTGDKPLPDPVDLDLWRHMTIGYIELKIMEQINHARVTRILKPIINKTTFLFAVGLMMFAA